MDVKKRFSEEQIIGFLREAEAGIAIKLSIITL
ncbi:transposase [Xanthomonas citri pv. thirumalacharii]|nr:transposase [Xanthomonas citri pv. thirumalacharii]